MRRKYRFCKEEATQLTLEAQQGRRLTYDEFSRLSKKHQRSLVVFDIRSKARQEGRRITPEEYKRLMSGYRWFERAAVRRWIEATEDAWEKERSEGAK